MIIKLRFIIFIISFVLFVICGFLIPQVSINYDNTKYLPEDVQTLKALNIMEEEFGLNGYIEIMVKNVSINESLEIYYELNLIENIKYVDFNPQSDLFYTESSSLYKISFTSGNYDELTKLSIENLKIVLTEYEYYIRGESITATVYNNVLKNEIIIIILILIPIVLFVLFITTKSWFEPLIFIIVVLFSVFINMGTNVFFGSISYITHATCGVLQLAICMDYSVIFLHSYRKNNLGMEKTEAIKAAMKSSFLPILSSALTTFFGFVALMTMRYKIGFDIGAVLAKGTIISVLSVFLLMPGLVYVFDSLLKKTEHKTIFKTNKALASIIYKSRFVVPIFALIIIVGAFFTQRNNEFVYSEHSFVTDSESLSLGNRQIESIFGYNNMITILIPQDLYQEGILLQKIQNLIIDENIELKALTSVTLFYTKFNEETFSMFLSNYGLDEASVLEVMNIFNLMKMQFQESEFSINELMLFIEETSFLTEEQKQMFSGFSQQIAQAIHNLSSSNYNRIILTVDMTYESEQTFDFVSKLNSTIENEFDEYYLLGESVGIYDIKEVVNLDFNRTNTLIIILVVIIMLISFKSLSIPVILILLIQGAIWINMAVPALLNNDLLFIGYIIVSCIMLGATIDYAILYSNRYLNNRYTLNKKETMSAAFEETKTTVLTSGIILIIAGYTLSLISSVPSIAIFGNLIGRGAIASTILVLFVLPQTLVIFDKLILKTTIHKRKI